MRECTDIQVIFISTHAKYYLTQTQNPAHQSQSTSLLTFDYVVCLSSLVGNCVSNSVECLNVLSIACFNMYAGYLSFDELIYLFCLF